MKENIHPAWYPEATVICACGNTWTTGATTPELRTDICSACHPFYTGEQRIVDTEGQVDRFMRRMGNRTVTANQPQAARRSASRNKANVPPPPQERRPARQAEAADEAAETEEAATEA